MRRTKTKSLASSGKKKASSRGKVKEIETKLPKKKGRGESRGSSLVFFKESPVTFRLSRLENPDDFELMNFVVKACDKADSNPLKTVLHVEQARTGSRIVACDGIRLYAAEISKKIKSGDYKPHVTKDTITLGESEKGIDYPELVKAIPEKVERRGVINLEKSGLGKDREETERLSIAFNAFVKQTGKMINLRDLDDLPKRIWTVYTCNEDSTIILRQQDRKTGEGESKYPLAVILPIEKAA